MAHYRLRESSPHHVSSMACSPSRKVWSSRYLSVELWPTSATSSIARPPSEYGTTSLPQSVLSTMPLALSANFENSRSDLSDYSTCPANVTIHLVSLTLQYLRTGNWDHQSRRRNTACDKALSNRSSILQWEGGGGLHWVHDSQSGRPGNSVTTLLLAYTL